MPGDIRSYLLNLQAFFVRSLELSLGHYYYNSLLKMTLILVRHDTFFHDHKCEEETRARSGKTTIKPLKGTKSHNKNYSTGKKSEIL